MIEVQRNARRARLAATDVIDGRDITNERELVEILRTLDHMIALVLLMVMERDPKKALLVFSDGIIPAVEQRFIVYSEQMED